MSACSDSPGTGTGPAVHGGPQIRLEIRSNPLYLAGVRELVGSVARRLGFTEEAAGHMSLAVDEALCNVIRHGYGRAPDRPIWLSLWPEGGAWSAAGGSSAGSAGAGGSSGSGGAGCECSLPDALRIIIEDEAPQVDPSAIRSRSLDDIRPGGLGVHIIQSVMDEARFEKREHTGMRLVMLKRRAASRTGPLASSSAAHA